jgi:hypothetical protein
MFLQHFDGAKDLRTLFVGVVHGKVGMDITMRPDFEKAHAQQMVHFWFMFGHPLAGHEECGRNAVLDQIVHQWLIVAGTLPHGTEIECQCDTWAGRRAGFDDLGSTFSRRKQS